MERVQKIEKAEKFRLALQLVGLAIFIYFGSQSTFYVVLLSIPVALLLGPVYCGWMCPRGMFQNVIGSMGKRVLGARYNKLVPKKLHKPLSCFRYVVLLFLLTAMVLHELRIIDDAIMESVVIDGLVVIMVLSILLSFFVDRAACRYFCKEGAAASLTNLVKIRKIRRDPLLCNSCGICDRVCPMWIDVSRKDVVRDTACISCMKCVQKCPVDALRVE
ncbi:4Fe-4S binding protein [Methanococcoides methylutens]|uniref:Putative iron-sulfur cluster binding protein YccM n=1 Tax=Methanococcoides methylutens MM1 TaxID=1434104 RepID=A0A0E3SSK0_METMT|nr:4Fe-4S binding protein [Methanococcoides methylutens]AKB85548.1 putative iron-sulfur cluster binding protein YccM [Methanococcoides methylutens MM1]